MGVVMPRRKSFDVFLSHDSRDKSTVEALAARLEDQAGLKPFLDKWHLVPGEPWQEGLEQALDQSRTCAVILGEHGIGPWENEEMRSALEMRVKRSSFRVVPVLLPGATAPDVAKLPPFLRRLTWVDFRTGHGLDDPDAFQRLVAGIRGIQPGRTTHGPAVPDWLTILALPELRNPTGIAVDGSTLYVADHSYGHVLRIDNGQVVGRFAGLDRPHHVAAMNGFLLIADSHHNRIVCLDAGFQEVWSRQRFGTHRLARPHGVAQITPEEFYVLSSDNHCLLFVSHGKVRAAVRNASRLPSAEPGQFSTPCGIGLGPRTVYVADTFNHRIQVFTSDLHYMAHFGNFGYGFGEFAYPVGIANWHEWLVIADEHNQRLQLWRLAWVQTSFTASCVAESVCADWLASPFGLAFNPHGTLYVADRKGGKVLEIDFQRLLSGLTASPRARQSTP
jgi:hypothetical protein